MKRITQAFADGHSQLDALAAVRAYLAEHGENPDQWGWEYTIEPAPASVGMWGDNVGTWRASAEFCR